MSAVKSAEVRRILERYLVEVVERYELCPWARSSRLAGEIAIDILWGTPPLDAWVDAATIALGGRSTRVAMIVAPELAIARDDLRALRDEVAARIPSAGVAHFHPDAPLDLGSASRLVPFVRRSPDPLLQLVPLHILDGVRGSLPHASLPQQAQILAGRASSPRDDAAERIARANYATVTAQRATMIQTLQSIAADRREAYARVGIASSVSASR